MNRQKEINLRCRQTEGTQARAIRLKKKTRQRCYTSNSVETEEQKPSQLADLRQCATVHVNEETEEERTSHLADLSQCANVRFSDKTEKERSSCLK